MRVLRRGLGSVAVAAMMLACLVAPAGATPVATPSVAWTRQFGTVNQDYIGDIDSASNGTFATGLLGGGVFLRRYRADGTVAWNRTFIQSDADYPGSVDAYGDHVYVAGSLTHESGSHTDGFLRKFTAGGTLQWSRFPGSPGIEYVDSVKATGNGVYVAGHTYGQIGTTAPRGEADAFLIRYSHAGAVQWVIQFGTAGDDVVSGLAITPAGVVVAGSTTGQLAGQTSAGNRDSYVRTYAFDGTHRWTRQFGSPGADAVIGAVVDRGAIYVVGETTGRLGPGDAGGADAFIRKLGADGSTKWTRQFGGAARDAAYDVEAAGGSVYVTGETEGAIPGGQHRGGRDAFARRYSPAGGVSWTHQFGGSADDTAFAIDANTSGVYVSGATSSALSGSNKGATDAFLRRLVSYRSDGSISRASSSGYRGNDVYNATASGQTVAARAGRGERRTFFIRAQNDGDAADALRVNGCGGGNGFGVRYFAGVKSDTEITRAVVAGDYRFAGVAPAEVRVLRVVIKVRNAADVGAVKSCAVSLRSVTKGNRDVVRARVTVES